MGSSLSRLKQQRLRQRLVNQFSFTRRQTSLLVFVGLVIASCTIMVFWDQHRDLPGSSYLSSVTARPREFLANSGHRTASFFSGLTSRWNSTSRLEKLEAENRELRSRLLTLRLSLDSATQMTGLGAPDYAIDTVPAYVVGQSDPFQHRTLIISKGRRDGIDPDFPVLCEGSLVGRTTKVLSGSSRILLLTDPQSAVGVKVLAQNRVPTATATEIEEGVRGILQGSPSGDRLILEVERNSAIQLGDEVLTSRLSTIYPEGLHIGVVGELLSKTELLKTFSVEPAVDFQDITRVDVYRYLSNREALALLRDESQ